MVFDLRLGEFYKIKQNGNDKRGIKLAKDNRDKLLLTHAIGEDLVSKLEASRATYKVNDDGSVNFENRPPELLQEIKIKKNA